METRSQKVRQSHLADTRLFSRDIEEELVQYILTMEEMMFGLTTVDIRDMAYQLAERNHIDHPIKNEIAGRDWLRGFLSRNKQLSIRQPESTSAARARGFNHTAVNRFFDLLEALMEEHKFPPDKIYNVDETGMTTVQSRPSKIVALRGRKQVGSLTSAERGVLVTTEICMSATGSFVPPLFVWPRVRMKPELMDGAPPGSIFECHKSGWMQTDIFTTWFKHFVKVSGASNENKVLLILDGHKTHTQNLAVINIARKNGVFILSLPPHCTHRLQPLDVAFMKPLSTYYTQEVECWMKRHPGRCVTVFQLANFFGVAYLKSATAQTAANGFRQTGIYPVNHNVFEDFEFASSSVTEQAETTTAVMEETSGNGSEITSVEGIHTLDELPSLPDNTQQPDEDTEAILSPIAKTSATPSGPKINGPEPVIASASGFVSPFDISPPPKADKIKKPKRKSRKPTSEHITSSPYKKLLVESFYGKVSAAIQKKRSTIDNKSEQSSIPSKKLQKTVQKRRSGNKSTSQIQYDSSDSEDDTFCLFCREIYSKAGGEGWIQCIACKEWAHDDCAGVDDDDIKFVCDYCR